MLKESTLREFLSIGRFRPIGKRAKRVPEKLYDFSDENTLHYFDLARFLISRASPSDLERR